MIDLKDRLKKSSLHSFSDIGVCHTTTDSRYLFYLLHDTIQIIVHDGLEIEILTHDLFRTSDYCDYLDFVYNRFLFTPMCDPDTRLFDKFKVTAYTDDDSQVIYEGNDPSYAYSLAQKIVHNLTGLSIPYRGTTIFHRIIEYLNNTASETNQET